MTGDERRLWPRYLIDLLRPEARTARPARRALVADALLAVVLTAAALFAAAGAGEPGDAPHPVAEFLRLRPELPAVPGVRSPPPLPAVPTPSPLPALPTPPAGFAEVGYAGAPDPGTLLLVACTALPLAVRRRYPLGAFWAVLIPTLALDGGETWVTVLTAAIAAYSAVAHSRNRVPAVAGLLLAAVLAGAAEQDIVPSLPSWLGPYVVLLSAGTLASFVRFWQHSRDRLTELQRTQETATREAVKAERSRIASELHDVVTHNVSVMVIQAGAARKVLDAHPGLSKEALIAIEAGGRAALAELRNVMGLLAGTEGHAEPGDGLEPQPGLEQLDGLIERVRAAGVPVDVAISPPRDPLPPGVELAVYRVVQEALTNTIKHAAGAAASVTIGHDGGCLEIEVTDTGGAARPRTDTGGAARPRTGGGRGLIGLRERLALYGGTLEAAPRPGGGYRLKARIPARAA